MTNMRSPNDGPLAVLADIHGNRWALEAVLADIDRRGVRDIVDLGDSLQGPLDPAGVADLLLARGIPSIQGNCDRMLTDPATPLSPTLAFDRDALKPEHIAWLQALRPTAVHRDTIFRCHGTPQSDTTYLLEDPTERGGVLCFIDEIAAAVHDVTQPVVLCGHSHVPRSVWLPDGKLVVNPGSVGLPAYSDDTPHPHVMQAGSPHARYALLTETPSGWAVEHIAVPYDWAAAARAAEARGRDDWASALRTGRASLS
ncbi:MAG TPA: metallophosphoesterase family protein [Ktedonobacterales bacterium]